MPLSQQKAVSLFENFKNIEESIEEADLIFVASRGWCEKFKRRPNLHNISMGGAAVSEDTVPLKLFFPS